MKSDIGKVTGSTHRGNVYPQDGAMSLIVFVSWMVLPSSISTYRLGVGLRRRLKRGVQTTPLARETVAIISKTPNECQGDLTSLSESNTWERVVETFEWGGKALGWVEETRTGERG